MTVPPTPARTGLMASRWAAKQDSVPTTPTPKSNPTTTRTATKSINGQVKDPTPNSPSETLAVSPKKAPETSTKETLVTRPHSRTEQAKFKQTSPTIITTAAQTTGLMASLWAPKHVSVSTTLTSESGPTTTGTTIKSIDGQVKDLTHSPKETPATSPKQTPVTLPKETPASSPEDTPATSTKETPTTSPEVTLSTATATVGQTPRPTASPTAIGAQTNKPTQGFPTSILTNAPLTQTGIRASRWAKATTPTKTTPAPKTARPATTSTWLSRPFPFHARESPLVIPQQKQGESMREFSIALRRLSYDSASLSTRYMETVADYHASDYDHPDYVPKGARRLTDAQWAKLQTTWKNSRTMFRLDLLTYMKRMSIALARAVAVSTPQAIDGEIKEIYIFEDGAAEPDTTTTGTATETTTTPATSAGVPNLFATLPDHMLHGILGKNGSHRAFFDRLRAFGKLTVEKDLVWKALRKTEKSSCMPTPTEFEDFLNELGNGLKEVEGIIGGLPMMYWMKKGKETEECEVFRFLMG